MRAVDDALVTLSLQPVAGLQAALRLQKESEDRAAESEISLWGSCVFMRSASRFRRVTTQTTANICGLDLRGGVDDAWDPSKAGGRAAFAHCCVAHACRDGAEPLTVA